MDKYKEAIERIRAAKKLGHREEAKAVDEAIALLPSGWHWSVAYEVNGGIVIGIRSNDGEECYHVFRIFSDGTFMRLGGIGEDSGLTLDESGRIFETAVR